MSWNTRNEGNKTLNGLDTYVLILSFLNKVFL